MTSETTTERVRRGHWWELTPPDSPPVPDHPQVAITHDGRTADVDEDMAPLVLALWAAGIDTVACCQGDGDRRSSGFQGDVITLKRGTAPAYVAFASPDDRRRFGTQVRKIPHLTARWEWSIDHDVDGHAESVHFPAADIAGLVQVFRT